MGKGSYFSPGATCFPAINPAYQSLLEYFLYMKHLEDALKQKKKEEAKTPPQLFKPRSKIQLQKWTLDPDGIEESPQQSKERLAQVIQTQLRRRFQCEKYLEEETFRELMRDLTTLFTHFSSELEKLIRIDEILQTLSDSFTGQLKNYLKHVQSLLDAKIRKLKKKGKRSQLIEFDRLVASETHMKRKNEVYFINEDEKGVKYPAKQLRRQESKHDSSKRSFGTMNSGSNQNQSGGSGKSKSGNSKSGESKALAVLLANIDAQQERKGPKKKQQQRQKYEFTSILNATSNIRHRKSGSRLSILNENTSQQSESNPNPHPPVLKDESDNDQAFIFHYPKHHKHKF